VIYRAIGENIGVKIDRPSIVHKVGDDHASFGDKQGVRIEMGDLFVIAS
jgi:hypothetical protein